MKKTLLTLALTAACVGAFAQGKINVVNDANHAVYNVSDNSLVTAASGLRIDLYGYQGTAAGGSFQMITSSPLNPAAPGLFGPFNYNSPIGGAISTFQVRVFDPAGLVSGQSQIFTLTSSSALAYASLVNAGGTVLSTWAAGTQAVAGGFGAIGVSIVPEPTTMVLAGLGAASLLMFRRRS